MSDAEENSQLEQPFVETSTFDSLPLKKWLKDQCRLLGFEHPTPVQDNCIPRILEGKVSKISVTALQHHFSRSRYLSVRQNRIWKNSGLCSTYFGCIERWYLWYLCPSSYANTVNFARSSVRCVPYSSRPCIAGNWPSRLLINFVSSENHWAWKIVSSLAAWVRIPWHIL